MPSPAVLHTTAGDVPLAEGRIAVGGRTWAVAYTSAVVSTADEAKFLAGRTAEADALPYGVALWPAALALAHDVATQPAAFQNKTVLELGAGTGLPGIVAAALGAAVTQTDRQELALHICKRNGEKNGSAGITYRLADWTAWDDPARYDWILGSDILYAEALHAPLRRIFETNLTPGGRVLLADPYRLDSMPLLESMEADGWRVAHARWTVGEGDGRRPIAVYEFTAPPPGTSP